MLANTIRLVATTVHVPEARLQRVDSGARALGISRNRYIVSALEESLGTIRAWPPELARMLEQPVTPGAARELEESLTVVRRRRLSRRKAPAL